MHWSARAGVRVTLFAWLVVLPGCRADVERDEPAQTILVRDAAAPPAEPCGYDSGERTPSRIEVVVADGRGGGGDGPSPLASLVGRSVRIQFRRDALGLAAPAPVPPTGQGPGGRAVHLMGTVRSASGAWLVLERDKNTYYIPLASILLIEQTDAPTTGQTVE